METIDAEVHGGITFSESDVQCDGEGKDDGYWVGFDCNHSYDSPDPELRDLADKEGEPTYWMGDPREGAVRSQEYVENECKKLCEQAAIALS